MEKKLSSKQFRFVQEYLVDLNATQAAVRAGYSPTSAASIASENLRKPEIAKALKDELGNSLISKECMRGRLVGELLKIALVPLESENLRLSSKLRAIELLVTKLSLIEPQMLQPEMESEANKELMAEIERVLTAPREEINVKPIYIDARESSKTKD